MGKWTPGPWKWEERWDDLVSANGTKVLFLNDDGACGDPECCGPAGYFNVISNKVDAHLIAAAPELYEALEAALPFTINNPGLHLNIKERLRKARGEDLHEDV